jgi:hypothetical protein
MHVDHAAATLRFPATMAGDDLSDAGFVAAPGHESQVVVSSIICLQIYSQRHTR